MFAPLGKDLAKIRAESLRDDGGPRSTKEPGRLRRALGHAFVVAGERLLRECRAPHAVRIGGGG